MDFLVGECDVEDNDFINDTFPLAPHAAARVCTDVDSFRGCPRRSLGLFAVLEFAVHVNVKLRAIPDSDEMHPLLRGDFIAEDFQLCTTVRSADVKRGSLVIFAVFVCTGA